MQPLLFTPVTTSNSPLSAHEEFHHVFRQSPKRAKRAKHDVNKDQYRKFSTITWPRHRQAGNERSRGGASALNVLEVKCSRGEMTTTMRPKERALLRLLEGLRTCWSGKRPQCSTTSSHSAGAPGTVTVRPLSTGKPVPLTPRCLTTCVQGRQYRKNGHMPA